MRSRRVSRRLREQWPPRVRSSGARGDGLGPRDNHPVAASGMVFLGFGKYARADRIYALEPITGNDRGNGKRTLVWVEGIAEPIVASRTQETILEEIEEAATSVEGRRRRARGRPAVEHPHLFDA